jgi:hypothetical protein
MPSCFSRPICQFATPGAGRGDSGCL